MHFFLAENNLLAGNPKNGIKDAGDLFVGDDGSNLYVKYVLDFAPYVFDEMHLEITEVGPGQIPQKKGNPIPGKFAYSNGPYFGPIPLKGEHPVTGVLYNWVTTPPTKLYIAAHGKICKDVDSIIAAIDDYTDTVTMDLEFVSSADVYLKITISGDDFLNGVYSGLFSARKKCIVRHSKIQALTSSVY